MITAYDSIDLNAIPGNPELVLYYVNGSWPASPASLARFTQQKESISVTPFANAGDWLDVETGDAFPWQAPGWVVMRRKAGHANPGVYVEYSKWAATINEFDLRGIPHPRWWVALYDGIAQVPAGADGKQYAADHPGTVYYSGGHYDKSAFIRTLAGDASHSGGFDLADYGAFITDIHTAVARLEVAFGTAKPDGSGPAAVQPNYLGWSQTVTTALATIQAEIVKIPTGGADLTALQASVNAIKAVTDQLAGIK